MIQGTKAIAIHLSVGEAKAFAEEVLLSPQRNQPVVALTTQCGAIRPLINPSDVLGELGETAKIIVLETGPVTWELTASLPHRLDVYGGAARIWWPGLTSASNPFDHPLIFVRDQDGSEARREIVHLIREWSSPVWRISTKTAHPLPAPLLETEREMALEIEEISRDRERLVEELRESREQAQALRKEVRSLRERQSSGEQGRDPLASPAAFLAAVCEAYASLYTASEQHAMPPQLMRVGSSFLGNVHGLEGVSIRKLIDVSAHVASGKVFEIQGLQAHPLRVGPGGSPQRVRASDGAKAWRCALEVGTPAARRLHWWSLQGIPGGAIEFAGVGTHDDMSIPE